MTKFEPLLRDTQEEFQDGTQTQEATTTSFQFLEVHNASTGEILGGIDIDLMSNLEVVQSQIDKEFDIKPGYIFFR